jgi:hypothetical protein
MTFEQAQLHNKFIELSKKFAQANKTEILLSLTPVDLKLLKDMVSEGEKLLDRSGSEL